MTYAVISSWTINICHKSSCWWETVHGAPPMLKLRKWDGNLVILSCCHVYSFSTHEGLALNDINFLCVPQDFCVLERSYCLYVIKHSLKRCSNKNFSSVKTMWLQTNVEGLLFRNIYQCSYCFNYRDSDLKMGLPCVVIFIDEIRPLWFMETYYGRSWIGGFNIIIFIDFDYAF